MIDHEELLSLLERTEAERPEWFNISDSEHRAGWQNGIKAFTVALAKQNIIDLAMVPECPYEAVDEGLGVRAHVLWATNGFKYCPECTTPLAPFRDTK